VLPPIKPFKQYGKSGMWLSELLPHIGSIADDICLVNSMHTEAVNHARASPSSSPAVRSRPPQPGRMGDLWTGQHDQRPPRFLRHDLDRPGQDLRPLFYDYYWGSGFLPSKYRRALSGEGDPVLYLANPDGMSRELRRGALDDIAALNKRRLAEYGDPEIETRITQYELAYRMQTSVPELLDISKEPSAFWRCTARM